MVALAAANIVRGSTRRRHSRFDCPHYVPSTSGLLCKSGRCLAATRKKAMHYSCMAIHAIWQHTSTPVHLLNVEYAYCTYACVPLLQSTLDP